jgi:hypothetical protein
VNDLDPCSRADLLVERAARSWEIALKEVASMQDVDNFRKVSKQR